MKAEYNITNNRLFLWPEMPKGQKLPPAQYEALKSAGVGTWWPRGCFTGLWSPAGEDLLIEIAGIIEANDSPDDLERRTERYEKYADKSETSAEQATERISSGRAHTARQLRQAEGSATREMDKAIYWNQRIAGAIASFQYKDRPDVIVRRIQNIEKDLRTETKYLEKIEARLELSTLTNKNEPDAEVKQKRQNFIEELEQVRVKTNRWIEHYNKRIQYETEYLDAVGGDPRKQVADVKVGDVIMYHGEECEVLRYGTKNLLIKVPSSKYARRIGREEAGEIVRRSEGDGKNKVFKPTDGIKKGSIVVWEDPYMYIAEKDKALHTYATAVVSLGSRKLKVQAPVGADQWIKDHGKREAHTIEIFRSKAKLLTGE